eukprot:CAMPEP_0197276742 /NCGR_PEP_ID=MMETSP1432-20130617/15870_1 /TAXON_ID=44447 /ORGANISM="Pseudo-nitzschia delicatissima, Strain UNC1205" /LENGTH=314 /DNA_ID=CAMNT_0042742837 /DNA_START=115 /DNA_END=1059 /DNA_ORIENTATION=-
MTSQEAFDSNVVSLSFLQTSLTAGDSDNVMKASPPPVLLVHGLDSSSQTWAGLLDGLDSSGFGAVAVDQRGCGKSSLGDPNQFSPDDLVDDLYALVTSHPMFSTQGTLDRPFVFVGHSMGGRIAMSFAAKYPETIAALIIEDMDIRTRSLSESRIRSKNRDATLAFDRELTGISTPQEVVEAYAKEGYEALQVEKWLSEGRVESNKDGDGYYSQVNPAFRLLCYEQFFETSHGEDAWKKLAAIEKNFPIHLMIGDPTMTICDDANVSLMEDIMQKSSSPLIIHRYERATHSIHNSVAESFSNDLKAIITKAQKP